MSARQQFLEALNEDWIRFRADSTENSIVREQVGNASPKWVSLVDAAREFGSDAQSAGPLAGHELFFEHVHLTPKGNYQLAKLLAAEVSRVVFGDGQPKSHWLDETECARAIGLTPFGELTLLRRMDELTARPPFTAQLDFAEERSRLKREIEALDAQLSKPSEWSPILASLEAALQRDPTPFLMFHLASAQAQVGHWVRALELNDQLALQEPVSPERIAQRAFLLQRLGRVNEAEALLLESAERDPFYFQTYGLLGSLWAERKEGAKARAYFESLVKRMPDNRAGRQMLAQFYSATDEAKAEEQWRAILDTAPDDEESLVALVERLFRTRRADEALTIMLRAYRYNPRNFANASRLEQIFEDKGDVEKTVQFMEAMAESGPVRPVLYADLAEKLVQLHRYDEAAFYKARGVNAARVVRDEALVRQLSAMSVPQ
jgi:tetratricopeptide (TPR) repeat protein